MALPPKPNNPNIPIPNNSFFAPLNPYVYGPYFPVAMGAGIDLNTSTFPTLSNDAAAVLVAGTGIALSTVGTTTTITATGGGGGGGGVTQIVAGSNIALSPSGGTGVVTVNAIGLGIGTVTTVVAGNGLCGGPITTSGSLTLNTNCVIQPNAFALKGNLLAGTGAGAYTALNPGSDGQVLIACASAGGAGGPGMCWSSVGSVTSVTGTLPISVATGTTTPAISIAAASTTGSGAVQLNNTVASTSTTQALTAAQGKVLQDQITSLVVNAGIELAGTIDASTGLVASVTSIGTSKGYAIGTVLPAASSVTNSSYVIVTTPGTLTPPGGTATLATRGDWFLVSETSIGVYTWQFLNVGFDAPSASTTVPGIVELATNAETVTGTDATTSVTPAGAAFAYIAKSALTAKGSLVSATGASTPSALGVGTDGQVLVACAAATTGLCWTAPTATGIPCACITAKGSLVSGTAAATPTALPVGTDGNILVACSTATTGLCWIAPTPSGIPCSCILSKGALITGTAGSTPVGFSTGLDGQLLSVCSACTEGLTWVSPGGTPAATPTALGTVYGEVGAGATGSTSSTSIGYNAGAGLGEQGVYIGRSAGSVDDTCCNTFVGFNAGCFHVNGDLNVAIGWNSMCNNQSGTGNVGVGAQTLMTGGIFTGANTAIGYQALCGILEGSNVAVGYGAGTALTNASQNVLIGPNVQAASATGSCQLAIGFSATCNWLTGDSAKNIKPGAGIRDCTGSLGLTNQVLSSTGSSLVWTTSTSGLSWVSAGTVQSVGITGILSNGSPGTAPTFSPTTYNQVRYRQVGNKEWEVQVALFWTNGTNGSGWYALTLPAGLQFDFTTPFQKPYTASPDDGLSWLFYGLTNSYARASQSGASSYQQGTIMPYDATRYRVMLVGPGTNFWTDNYYSAGGAYNHSIKLGFTFISL